MTLSKGVRKERECEDAIERLPMDKRPPVKLRQRPDDVLPHGAAHTAVPQRHQVFPQVC